MRGHAEATPEVTSRPIKCLNVMTGKFTALVNASKFWPGKQFINLANCFTIERSRLVRGNDKPLGLGVF